METVIVLLREKNHHLEKFYWVNEQELINFGVGNFDTIESFYQARERLLDAIKCVDGLIEIENRKMPTEVTDVYRDEVELLLQSKDELVKSILAQDLQILVYIEREKSNIIRDLRANSTAKRAVGAYAQAERNKQLDQE